MLRQYSLVTVRIRHLSRWPRETKGFTTKIRLIFEYPGIDENTHGREKFTDVNWDILRSQNLLALSLVYIYILIVQKRIWRRRADLNSLAINTHIDWQVIQETLWAKKLCIVYYFIICNKLHRVHTALHSVQQLQLLLADLLNILMDKSVKNCYPLTVYSISLPPRLCRVKERDFLPFWV